MTAARLRRLVGFAILCETLAEAAARGLLPYFFIKGGVAIELRLGLSARTTKDIDVGLCAAPQDLLPLFDGALTVGFGNFVLRRKGENRLLGNGVCSLKVSIMYMTRDWATVDVDLAPAEPDVAIEEVEPVALSDFGLATARRVPCLAIVEQVAQKIHALTEPNPRGKPNPRARDVIDVLALDARIALDSPAVANSCARLFKKRGVHDWPIMTYAFPSEWATTLPAIARDARYVWSMLQSSKSGSTPFSRGCTGTQPAMSAHLESTGAGAICSHHWGLSSTRFVQAIVQAIPRTLADSEGLQWTKNPDKQRFFAFRKAPEYDS